MGNAATAKKGDPAENGECFVPFFCSEHVNCVCSVLLNFFLM